ncbi:hypothetical protein EJB05_12032, partial [Eragrostis curvula]
MLLALAILLSLPAPSAADRWFCGDAGGTYKQNSTYMSNLRSLAGALIGDAARLHSATGDSGEGLDRVYGAVLCRGDFTGPDCASRLREAFGAIAGDAACRSAPCALHRDVAIYTELFQLRFSDKDFLSGFSNAPEWVDITNPGTVPHAAAAQFNELVTKLLSALADTAASQPNRCAAGEAPWSWSQAKERTVYGMAQCTRDMQPERCRSCLDGIIAERRQMIGAGKMGGAVFGKRCNLRYEIDLQFFNTTGNSEVLSLRKTKDHAFLIIATVYSAAVLCTRLFFWLLSIRRKQKRRKINSTEQLENFEEVLTLWRTEDAGLEFTLYDISQIADATDNFSPNNILGEGGFGPVYKGVFPDGQVAAIKRLSARSRQGLVEFKNEIQVIAKLQHKNLVRLLGCCIHDEEKMLIYEYLTNKSLDHFIFGTRASLKWKTRIRIIEGIAQGLLYLHNHSRLRIIHRDLKASNILLDSELNPKISDFGMARIFPSDATQATASRIVGTYSIKQHNNIPHRQAWGLWKDRRWNEVFDPSSGGEYEPQKLKKCLTVALMCVQEKATNRPTMPDVVAMLNSDGITLPEPGQPAYTYVTLDVSVNINVLCSRNDITISTANGRYPLPQLPGTISCLDIQWCHLGEAIFGAPCTLRYETDLQLLTDTGKTLSLNMSGKEQAILKLRRLSVVIQSVINLWRMEGGNLEFSQYDYSQLKEATDNFSDHNKLGQGGFGLVYKGRLSNGLNIAVKRLENCSLQGLLEFQSESQLIAKLQHKNLVKLLVCQHVLIDYTCSADNVKGQQLNWSKLLHIIDGIAQGLLYLHNYSRLCVVHRDLKASNILLDSEMNPKISDFGMARIFCSNMTESYTTRIAWKLWSDGKWGELIYSSPDIGHQEIERCIHVALLCVQERAEHRPDMEYVVTMLNNKDVSLPRPMQPAYFHVNPSKEEVSSCSITMSITLERTIRGLTEANLGSPFLAWVATRAVRKPERFTASRLPPAVMGMVLRDFAGNRRMDTGAPRRPIAARRQFRRPLDP